MEFRDGNLDHLLRGAINGLIGHGDDSGNIHDGLRGKSSNVLDHGIGDFLGLEANSLHGKEGGAEKDEGPLADETTRLNVTSHQDLLTREDGLQIGDACPDLIGTLLGADKQRIAEIILAYACKSGRLFFLGLFTFGTLTGFFGLLFCLGFSLCFLFGVVIFGWRLQLLGVGLFLVFLGLSMVVPREIVREGRREEIAGGPCGFRCKV